MSRNDPLRAGGLESRGLAYILVSAFAFLLGWLLAKLRGPNQQAASKTAAQGVSSPKHETAILSEVPSATAAPQLELKQKSSPLWKNILECVAVLIAFGLLLVNVFQTVATRRAAKAAEDANKIANDNLIRVQRPWLAVDGPMLTLTPVSIKSVEGSQTQMLLTVGFWVKNFGVAPAFHTAVYVEPVSYQRGTDIPAHNAEFDDTVKSTCRMADSATKPVSTADTGSGSYVFPNNRFGNQWPINATSPNPELNTWLTVVGCITYRDQFEKTPPHHTHFCFRSDTAITAITAKQVFSECGQNEEAN